ncbi:MAG: glycosyltransferase family 39 protein, partial [Desulfatitalea sp.]
MAKKEKMLPWLFVVVALTTVLKAVFVFKYTAYYNYLSSDMLGYWSRAFQRYDGDLFSINQWVIWPPLFHIILAGIFKTNQFLGLFHRNLEVVLSLNILFSSLSVVYLYFIAVIFSRNSLIALCTASLYALTYHCLYFNAFILSENFAVPIVIAALYYLLRNKKGYYLLSGALLAIATGIRPGYGLLGLSFGLYALLSDSKTIRLDWKRTIFFNGFGKAALFSLAFMLCIAAIVAENNYISKGRLKGLAASSGLNYYFSFTKTYEVRSRFDGYHYVIIPPGTVRNPENGKLMTINPIYDGAFFKKLANAYINDHPYILVTKIKDLWDLYFGTLFPSY